MSPIVAIVGSSGRVGSALVNHLADRFEVRAVTRCRQESAKDLAMRAAGGSSVVLNAAGVAHVNRNDVTSVELLRSANVELPRSLAQAALAAGSSFVHISSAKATDPGCSPYAQSKHEGDELLREEFGDAYESEGLSLIVVRPLALLFPPLNAGKVSKLRIVRHWPMFLTPPVPLPVLSPSTFVGAIEQALKELMDGTAPRGFAIRSFGHAERGTLRDVRAAFS
jgi:nucleoside-diphosphate-sugar epimerase